MKKGFTLGEVIITFGILGIIGSLIYPVLRNTKDNSTEKLYHKAYYITERMVSELINNEAFYPESEDPAVKPFFGNTKTINYKGKQYKGETKFCELFAANINKQAFFECKEKKFKDGNLKIGEEDKIGHFKTTDGMIWNIPITKFETSNEFHTIYVDVNGTKRPNCLYNKEKCNKPDRFMINVRQDGRIMEDENLDEYLN